MGVTAIVLAAGLSQRMGKNKLLLSYKDKPIIEYIIQAVDKSRVDEKIIITNDFKIRGIAESYGFDIYDNPNFTSGQSQSIRIGVRKMKDGNKMMFFVADQPFINSSIINKLIDEAEESKTNIIIPQYDGRNCNPVIFPSELRDEFYKLEGDVGGKVVIDRNKELRKYVEFPVGHENKNYFRDIDTIDDYNSI